MLIVLTFVLNAGLNFLLGLAIAGVLGPAEYGRFAVASMVAIVLGTAGFDWLRLSATRYYTEAGRAVDPSLRATLELGYWVFGAAMAVAAAIMLVLRIDVGLSAALLTATVALAVANARFDFATALARARFLEVTHALLMLAKNLLAFGLGVGAAFWFRDAAWVMGALALGAVLASLFGWRALRDSGARLRNGGWGRLGAFGRYGLPIVAANVIYQVIVLANRSMAAGKLGYADAGQLSLATDMTIRLLLALGAALDIYLFQLVVRRDSHEGREAAHAQVRRNMVIMTAILVLLTVGYAASMPAFQAVVVPAKYRGDFGAISLVLLPGILAFCLVNFGLNPVFQLAGRTGPVVVAAVAALVTDLFGLLLMPPSGGVLGYAAMHSSSLIVGGAVSAVLAFRTPECRPPVRDLAAIALGAVVAALAIWPMRSIPQPLAVLACAAVVGTLAYLAVLYWFDVAGLRGLVSDGLRRFRRSVSPRPAETRI